MVADTLEACFTPEAAYAKIGLPKDWGVKAIRRTRGVAGLIFIKPDGRKLKGMKAFVESVGGFPESLCNLIMIIIEKLLLWPRS